MSKIMSLTEAVHTHVFKGMHVHFASTPSRSNCTIREIARQFRGRKPELTLSATAFQSMAHLLGILRLGSRYVSAFFGDDYPLPRPNPLYTMLEREGATLEHWSLGALVAAFRAGALGEPYAITRSLLGSTVGKELAAGGRFVATHDPLDPSRPLGMVAAMRPDITVVHAAAADMTGRVISSAPYGEGLWSALAARRGVIATVERLVDVATATAHPESLLIPPQRLLAVCVEPYGAHPQPMHTTPSVGEAGYSDDYDHYEAWRYLAAGTESLDDFERDVLDAADAGEAYRSYVGGSRLASLVTRSAQPRSRSTSGVFSIASPNHVPESDAGALDNARMTVLAARRIVARVMARQYRVILAGLGLPFLACRLAKVMLASLRVPVEVNVETGLLDVECGDAADPFSPGRDNMAMADRLSSVEIALGALTCGADNRCLGVIGAAQVDRFGNVNTTRLADGRILVGSGGSNDIASGAAEVLVVTTCAPHRLVRDVDYITSPGERVFEVVTEACSFRRALNAKDEWHLLDPYPVLDDERVAAAVEDIRSRCTWDLRVAPDLTFAPGISGDELRLLQALRRERPPAAESQRPGDLRWK
jgi:acyl CoA:acetate/3-ketoacid CoA transferase alpha subunit/acyl CoA:acetate/3-ketoacid CoA transferase beta subunit